MKKTRVITIIQEKLPKYLKPSLPEKTTIVSSVCEVSGMHCKAIIRALAREQKMSKWKVTPKPGRPKRYTAETEVALAFIWEQYEYPCAERLVGEVQEAIRIFSRDGMWCYSEYATEQIRDMSLGSIKIRCVGLAKQKGLLRGISTTRSSDLLKSIPILFGPWDSKGPGYGQLDAVVRIGPKLMGTKAYSVDYTDVVAYSHSKTK